MVMDEERRTNDVVRDIFGGLVGVVPDDEPPSGSLVPSLNKVSHGKCCSHVDHVSAAVQDVFVVKMNS